MAKATPQAQYRLNPTGPRLLKIDGIGRAPTFNDRPQVRVEFVDIETEIRIPQNYDLESGGAYLEQLCVAAGFPEGYAYEHDWFTDEDVDLLDRVVVGHVYHQPRNGMNGRPDGSGFVFNKVGMVERAQEMPTWQLSSIQQPAQETVA